MKKILFILFVLFLTHTFSQCNTNNTICQSGTAGPFNFGAGSGPVSTCLDFQATSQFAYIVLYITQSGPLNLYINGNGTTGYLDVAVFNVPQGVAPCVAIQNNANEIGCNYASAAGGCSQFGNSFPCGSTVPAPVVTAGQVLMIVVEDWTNTIATTNFTLQLGPPPGAQTGPPSTTINPSGPFCTTSPLQQLTSVNNGGTWSGNGVGSTGTFNPLTAGPGTHTITYSLGQSPCNSTSTTQITVNQPPVINPIITQPLCFNDCNGSINANIPNATYVWTPGGQTTQIINNLCSGVYSVTITDATGCVSTSVPLVLINPPQINVGNINHN